MTSRKMPREGALFVRTRRLCARKVSRKAAKSPVPTYVLSTQRCLPVLCEKSLSQRRKAAKRETEHTCFKGRQSFT